MLVWFVLNNSSANLHDVGFCCCLRFCDVSVNIPCSIDTSENVYGPVDICVDVCSSVVISVDDSDSVDVSVAGRCFCRSARFQ